MIYAIFALLLGSLVFRFLEETREFQQFGYYMGQYLKHSRGIDLHGDHLFFYISSLLLLCDHVAALSVSLAFAVLTLLFQTLIFRGLKPKHPLAFTMRIRRLFFTLLLLAVGTGVVLALYTVDTFGFFFAGVAFTVFFLFAPLIIVIANILNRPMELAINRRYYDDAIRCVGDAPFVRIAAITGSYGKTSVKNILGELLKKDFNTLIPPSSYNTKLGLTKVIRSELIPTTEIFVAEMGAKKKGEIKETVEMIPPDISLITTISGQHLETFGSIENIISEKSQVYRGLKAGGIAVVNYDDEKTRDLPIPREVRKIYISTSAVPPSPCCYVEEIKVDADGCSFVLIDGRNPDRTEKIPLRTELLGQHNVFNILAAATMAIALGAKTDHIVSAVRRLKPVKNRLSTRVERGVTILEDAFNSNPVGAKAALDVLALMNTSKRVIITPGMIELGKDEKAIHMNFGRQIAQVCDEVILVTRKQTENIYAGLKDSGYDMSKVTIVAGMREALDMIKRICKAGDTVLIENDLPDVFEEVL